MGWGTFAPLDKELRSEYIRNMAILFKQMITKYRYLYDYISVSIPDKTSENYIIFNEIINSL